MERSLFLPGFSAEYQNWSYFQVLITVEDLVENFGSADAPNYRIKTTDEVEVIYSRKGISSLLQRALDVSRLTPIKNFMLNQPDAYVNNITVAIYGGDPEWLPLDLKKSSFPEELDSEHVKNSLESFGLIKLKGNETLFVLDGQHRLKSFRLAYEEDKSLGKNQVSMTLIVHIDSDEGRKKTRRLFSTINRYAKPVSLGENILLDEDDLSSILVRKFIEEYPHMNDNELIALNKTADLKMPKDHCKFTSVISLWNINELLIKPQDVYINYARSKANLVRIRPSDDIIEEYRQLIFEFWNLYFEIFPVANSFVLDPIVNSNVRDNGGPFSLRPIGQQIFAGFYKNIKNLGRLEDVYKFKIIPDDLNDDFWQDILFDRNSNRILPKKSFAQDYVLYHLGFNLTPAQQKKLLKDYRVAKRDEGARLPEKLINSIDSQL